MRGVSETWAPPQSPNDDVPGLHRAARWQPHKLEGTPHGVDRGAQEQQHAGMVDGDVSQNSERANEKIGHGENDEGRRRAKFHS